MLRIGGLGDPVRQDDDEIDRLIASLGQTTRVDRRLDILDHLVTYWHGPCQPEHGYPDEDLQGRPLPHPLRWWYRRGGRRPNILSHQNRLLALDELKAADDWRILFYVEAQGVYLWATAPQGNDPPVWGRFNEKGKPWVEEESTLSDFLIQMCLFESIFSAPYGASASWVDEGTLARVTAPLRPVPLGAWRWPSYPSRFWAQRGVFVFACPNGQSGDGPAYSIWVGAKTEIPLVYLKSIVDEGWEYAAF